MPVEIDAVLTSFGREYWANLFAGVAGFEVPDNAPPTAGWNPKITHFRIGEGGWEDLGAGPQPRAPSPGIVYESGADTGIPDLDAAVDAFRLGLPRYAANERFVFEKAFAPGDIVAETTTIRRFRCFLALGEANNDGFGNNPEFWEIGLFAEYPLDTSKRMCVAYGTMPKEIKHALKTLENMVRIRF